MFGTFIVAVFCAVEDWLEGQQPLRQRGPKPRLSDSEVLTVEIVGEFLGIDTDPGLYTYFRRNYREWFPALKQIHRTIFCRQAANLWSIKESLWKYLSIGSALRLHSLWWTAFRSRYAGSPEPTAAGSWEGSPLSATTKWQSRPFMA